MPTRIPPNNVLNLQTIEAVITGPDGANRLFTINGLANLGVRAVASGPDASVTQKETITLLVGPQLTRQQFHRAIASAFPTTIRFEQGSPITVEWSLTDFDADWDDESQQVELRVELQTTILGPVGVLSSLLRFGFQVTILAAL